MILFFTIQKSGHGMKTFNNRLGRRRKPNVMIKECIKTDQEKINSGTHEWKYCKEKRANILTKK